jgi:hypothetical protein
MGLRATVLYHVFYNGGKFGRSTMWSSKDMDGMCLRTRCCSVHFGLQWEMTGRWRKLHEYEPRNLYSSPNNLLLMWLISGDKMSLELSVCGRNEKYIKTFCWKTRREETIWVAWRRWKCPVEVDLKDLRSGMWTGFFWFIIWDNCCLSRKFGHDKTRGIYWRS